MERIINLAGAFLVLGLVLTGAGGVRASCNEKCPGTSKTNGKTYSDLMNCHPPDSDGTPQESLCNSAGRTASCGAAGTLYCCPKDGGTWTKDLTKCPNITPTLAPTPTMEPTPTAVPGCNGTTFVSGNVTPGTVDPGGSVTISCGYTPTQIDSIGAIFANSSCQYQAYDGTKATFTCTAPTKAGTYPMYCVTLQQTTSNSCYQQNAINSLVVNGPSPTPTSGLNPNVPVTPGINPKCAQSCSGKTLRDCTPPESDGTPNESVCNLTGRAETCGGDVYCCPSAGSSWTKTMTKCPTYVPDSAKLNTPQYLSCNSINQLNVNITGQLTVDTYHGIWVVMTDVKAKKTLTIAGMSIGSSGPATLSQSLTGVISDITGKTAMTLIGDSRPYIYKIYDGITNKDGSPNLTKLLAQVTFGAKCSNLPASACSQCPNQPTWKANGDADCSGSTNINDASIWRSEFIAGGLGAQISSSWKSDFDCDGKVTLNDYSIWRTKDLSSLSGQ